MIQSSPSKTRQYSACAFRIQQINIITKKLQEFITFSPFIISTAYQQDDIVPGQYPGRLLFILQITEVIHPLTPHLPSQPKTHNILQEMR